MKTILVPTDFSKCANNAMMYALEIAERTGQSITVLYVVYPNEGVDNNMYDAFFVDDYVKQRLDGMKTWVKKFTRSPHLNNIKVDLECRIGFPVSTITQTATELGASLIVMGTTGASGLRGIILGSTAGGVISSSATPVFVVPLKAVFRNAARFAFATDFKLSVSKGSLQVMREMLREFQRLTLSDFLPIHQVAHRWRFALGGRESSQTTHYYCPQLRLGIAGDWCVGGRVEGAFISGLELAKELLGVSAMHGSR